MASPPYQVPAEHRGFLFHPVPDDIPGLLQANATRLQTASCTLAGVPFETLLPRTRDELFATAHRYSRPFGPEPDRRPDTVLATGHQPGPFHPGIWVKNALVDAVARKMGVTGLNIIIDSDSLHDPTIRRPVRKKAGVHLQRIPLSHDPGGIPAEDAETLSASELRELAGQVDDGETAEPLREFLQQCAQAAETSRDYPDVLVQARRQLEHQLGWNNLEVRISHLATSTGFQHLALEIFDRMEEFWQAYNGALADYRQAHGIRSQANPLPDLHREGSDWETPFWLWHPRETRQPLRLRMEPGHCHLLHDNQPVATFSRPVRDSRDEALAVLEQLDRKGLRLRSRAIVTTWFMRMFLCDGFVHGVGGSHYDDVTDEIARRFLKLDLPDYIVASATLRLPEWATEDAESNGVEDLSVLERAPYKVIRRLLPDDPEAGRLAQERQELLSQMPADKAARAETFAAVKQLEARMKEKLAPLLEQKRAEAKRRAAAARSRERLLARDYPIALYPLDFIASFFRDIL